MGKVTDAVRALAAPLCEERGLMLWDVRFEKLGGTNTLSVFVDSDDGADIDDCEAVSRALEALLDGEPDLIDGAYSLEVSTPGMERRLERPEHFLFCLGERTEVKTYEPRDGKKTFFGILSAYDEAESRFSLEDEESGETLDFTLGEVSRVRLSPDFSVYFKGEL